MEILETGAFMKKKWIYWAVMATVLLTAVIGVLTALKKIRITPVFAGRFAVSGVDVSHYQGTIDWAALAKQDIDFAFIKATEGSAYLDERFCENWQAAGETGLCVGAYHFFSFDSEGKKQAQFFIDTVGSLEGKLAPAVDVEFYGDKSKDPPPKEEVVRQLGELLAALEDHYQAKPVIYTTYEAYFRYIKDEFDAYPLWIRNVYYRPVLTANTWTFWQYSDTAVLEGYQGAEKYIDRNVFRGTREELQKLLLPDRKTNGEEDASAKEGAFKEADGFTVWDEKAGKEQDIPLSSCNLEYETEQVRVYSYLGMTNALYLLTPEEGLTYPVKNFRNFWLDEEKEALFLVEEKETEQVRRIDLSPERLLEESVLLGGDELETLLADTYGISRQTELETFTDLQVTLFCQEEDGKPFLGGRVSGILRGTGREFEIVYEIDRESEAVSARGYLQDLAIAPLFQEFLLHNLTVQNPLQEDAQLGKELGFFDDVRYLSKAGSFRKQFAVVDRGEEGGQELLFRMSQTKGEEDWIYILAQKKKHLVCRKVLKPDFFKENPQEVENYRLYEVCWLDCASFLEIPTQSREAYLSREEVFASVAEGDLSVVVRKPFDPEQMLRSLEMGYEEGDSRRLVRRDIDGDGFDELLLLIKYDFEAYERISFILDYRNGRAVCVYLDWLDGKEWLYSGEAGQLVHCSYTNNGRCFYYGFYECTLNERGIKEIDYTGNGTEVCYVFEIDPVGMGLWWWKGQQPEITQPGAYFTRVYQDYGTEGGRGERKKELISKEEFYEAFTELTGEQEVWSEVFSVANMEYKPSSDNG